LVRAVLVNRDGVRSQVEVAYGTSKLKSAQRQNVDLIIQNAEQLRNMGLPQATRFDLDPDNCVWLPWASEWFEARDNMKTPVIGHLTERYEARLRRIARRYATKTRF
jgi:hypothetical protein